MAGTRHPVAGASEPKAGRVPPHFVESSDKPGRVCKVSKATGEIATIFPTSDSVKPDSPILFLTSKNRITSWWPTANNIDSMTRWYSIVLTTPDFSELREKVIPNTFRLCWEH